MLPQYRGIVAWDFEYRPDVDHRQSPVCATFLELRSGRRVALWGEFGAQPPFPTAGDWLWLSYHASAETQCHLALGWSIPETILDLEAEYRCQTSNYALEAGKGLPSAMREYGLLWSDVVEKPAMIELILRGGAYTSEERRQIIEYCWLDTDGLAVLLPRILPDIMARPNGWALALIRGYYSGHCIAHMEHVGIPLDVETYRRFDRNWDAIRARLVANIARNSRFMTAYVSWSIGSPITWSGKASHGLSSNPGRWICGIRRSRTWVRCTPRLSVYGSFARPCPSFDSTRSP
jgi:hypothetical protein